MAEFIGEAIIEVKADTTALDRSIANAQLSLAAITEETQRLLDGVQASFEDGVRRIVREEIDAALQRIAKSAARDIRGSGTPGSITNPVVTRLTASKFYPLGSYGAGGPIKPSGTESGE